MTDFLTNAYNWVQAHGVFMMVVTWLVGTAISTLPTPGENSGGFYKWFFGFATLVGASLPRSVPQLRFGQKNG